jgi:bacterioferritin (cytochrome b1)
MSEYVKALQVCDKALDDVKKQMLLKKTLKFGDDEIDVFKSILNRIEDIKDTINYIQRNSHEFRNADYKSPFKD